MSSKLVHVFYYPWYGSIGYDSQWMHWNHRILPHWNDDIKLKYPFDVEYQPPDDIGSNFYPARGPYSSLDPDVILSHLSELAEYVVIVSWWGRPNHPFNKDGQGYETDRVMKILLETAERTATQIAIHLEPYEGRTAETVQEDLLYIMEEYGNFSSLYRDPDCGNRPVVYIYDSYHTSAYEWTAVFSHHGKNSIRGTANDFVVLALLVTPSDWQMVTVGGFDGVYTYFSADSFTYGSTSTHWLEFALKAREIGCMISLSVGPGYVDTRIRPWNTVNSRERRSGQYYRDHFERAIAARPNYISVTSYNEWHEGTQIEAAIPKSINNTVGIGTKTNGEGFVYEDYESESPNYYLELTATLSRQFLASF